VEHLLVVMFGISTKSSKEVLGRSRMMLQPTVRPVPLMQIIVCVGLGARFLGGVEDKTVYPSRGQTVILHAPWVRFGRTFEGAGGRSGDVVVGSTQCVDDWRVLFNLYLNIIELFAGTPNLPQKHSQTRACSLSGTCTTRRASIKNANG